MLFSSDPVVCFIATRILSDAFGDFKTKWRIPPNQVAGRYLIWFQGYPPDIWFCDFANLRVRCWKWLFNVHVKY